MPRAPGHALTDIAEHCHAAAFDPALWPQALGALAGATGAVVASVFLTDHHHPGSVIEQMALHGGTQDDAARYGAHYGARDIRFAPLAALGCGELYADGRQLAYAEVCRSETFADFFRPLGVGQCVGVKLFDAPDRLGMVALHRPFGADQFGGDALALLRGALPHLRQAMQVQRQLQHARAAAGQAALALDHFPTAVFVVDAALRLLDLNRAAEALLRRPASPLRLTGGVLGPTRTDQHAALRRAMDAVAQAAPPAAPPAVVRLLGPAGAAGVMAVRAPPMLAGEAAIGRTLLFVNHHAIAPAIDPAIAAAEFGLTLSEAQVAAALAAGQRIAAVADQRGVSIQTVRAQLKAVHAKLNVGTQAQLTARLAASLAALRR